MHGKMRTFAIAFAIGSMLTLDTIADEAVLSSPRIGFANDKIEGSHDDPDWTNPSSGPTWYYNGNSTPASTLPGVANQIVAMLWGNDQNFHTTRGGMIDGGLTTSHGFAFNDLDACSSAVYGGSGVDAETVVQTRTQQMEPLKDLDMKLNALAGTFVQIVIFASISQDWTRNFSNWYAGRSFAEFIPIHYYEHFKRFASHGGQVNTAYVGMSLGWTECGFAEQCIKEMQSFFNQTSQHLEWMEHVMHYSHFGFSQPLGSNIGPNATMLTGEAELTPIGSQYLDDATAFVGNVLESDAAQVAGVAGWAFLLVGVSFWILA